MARKYYRRRYRRRTGKWSSDIKTFHQQYGTGLAGPFADYLTLCQNPSQDDATVSQKYTVKNIDLNFQIELPSIYQTGGQVYEDLCAFVMYVPEGYQVSSTAETIKKHPEWIMAYKYLGSPDVESSTTDPITPGRLPCHIKTRLARKLNTGDGVILYVTCNRTSAASDPANPQLLDISGMVRWWSKAN